MRLKRVKPKEQLKSASFESVRLENVRTRLRNVRLKR